MTTAHDQHIGFREGELLLGRYRIEKTLGCGPFASVYRAADTELRSVLVAIKQFHPHLITTEKVRIALRAQVLEMRQLSHNHIVRTYDLEQDSDGQIFLVTEFCDGWNLAELLRARAGNTLKLHTAVYVLSCLSSALSYAHSKGLLHTNIKPENILILRSGEIKVADFSLNRAFDEADGFTATGEAVAHPMYMAPEQFTLQPLSPQTDLYSLGALGYQLLGSHDQLRGLDYINCARTHIGGELPTLFKQEEIPKWLETLLSSCCKAESSQRPASATVLHNELQSWQQQQSINTKQILNSLSPQLLDQGYRRWRIATAFLLLCTFLAIVLTFSQRTPRQEFAVNFLKFEKSLGLHLSLLKQLTNLNHDIRDPFVLHKAFRSYTDNFERETLLRAGANTTTFDELGRTPIHYLLETNPADAYGVYPHLPEINLIDTQGNTLLHRAVQLNLTQHVIRLLDYNANCELRNKEGLTALQLAFDTDNQPMLSRLLLCTRYLDQRTPDGKTLVMLALENFSNQEQSIEVLKILLQLGAPLHAFDNSGRSTLDYARATSAAKIIEFVGSHASNTTLSSLDSSTP